MKISLNEVDKIAKLAQLQIDDATREKMVSQLGNILQYMDKLNDADVTDVDRSAGALEAHNVLRQDVQTPSPGPSVTLANAPERDEDFYVVPGILKG
jgi:aspartyl-tRNA(Asn)/glutamyl-tRNA(Gln) amidotransferase subunit C